MSIEAMMWAMNLAPVPYDKTKPNAACAAVLIGLANHADPDGKAAFPAIETLVRYTRLARRTVISALDRLVEDEIITACDPEVIAAKIKRADRRPNGYDLQMDRYRDDLSVEELQAIHRSNPMLRHAVQALIDGVQPLHLDDVTRGATSDARGATTASRGATTASRGAAAAPEPTKNPPLEPNKETDSLRSSAQRQPETTIDVGWKGVTDPMRAWFVEQDWAGAVTHPGVETQNFVDHHTARGSKMRDWTAAWRTWMRNAGTKYAGSASRAAAAPQRPQVSPEHSASRDGLF